MRHCGDCRVRDIVVQMGRNDQNHENILFTKVKITLKNGYFCFGKFKKMGWLLAHFSWRYRSIHNSCFKMWQWYYLEWYIICVSP